MSKLHKVPQVPRTDFLEVTEEIIRKRAYELFEQRGYEHGHDMDDWLQAEAEVTAKKPGRADLIAKRSTVAAA